MSINRKIETEGVYILRKLVSSFFLFLSHLVSRLNCKNFVKWFTEIEGRNIISYFSDHRFKFILFQLYITYLLTR